jgi:hypothetical protein
MDAGADSDPGPGARPALSTVVDLRRRIVRPSLLALALGLFVLTVVSSALHYTGHFPGNHVSWISWVVAVAAFGGAFVGPNTSSLTFSRRSIFQSEVAVAVFTLVLFLPTHLWNFDVAPWNVYGLFDDAAWDIYFARNHAFEGPFQPAFFDTVGYISREVVFHHYVTAFFRLFGYNLLVFNVALLVLGFVTVLFTSLIVHRLFRNPAVTALAAVILNFFPLHYLHIFVGHRYAIAAPLMVVSLYFLYSGFQQRSGLRLTMSALFAALCLGSAVMGKQFILGLVLAAVLVPVLDRARWRSAEFRSMSVIWTTAFVISAAPLLVYIAFNSDGYFGHEGALLGEFMGKFGEQGVEGVRPYFEQLWALFLDGDTFARLWLHDSVLIPLAYYPLLLGGLVIALTQRRFEIAFLAAIPIGSALVSGAFDFRVLLAAPVWVIAIGFYLDSALRRGGRPPDRRLGVVSRSIPVIALGLVLLGVVPSAQYLWDVSTDTHHQYLFEHRDVAVARLVQDIVAGSEHPTIEMKPDEFRRGADPDSLAYDTFVCPGTAYAVMHAYLQGFDDRRILAFCDQGNESLLSPPDVIRVNVAALSAYQPTGKPIMLIWEEHPNAEAAIAMFRRYEHLAVPQSIAGSVETKDYSLFILSIPGDRVAEFQKVVAEAYAGGGGGQ